MTTTIHKQVLADARALIADARRWTSGTPACDANGRRVGWEDPAATRWCALGALRRAAYDLVADRDQAIGIGNAVVSRLCPAGSSFTWYLHGYLPGINDMQGHAAVLALLDNGLADA
jgi:hypothetical protein